VLCSQYEFIEGVSFMENGKSLFLETLYTSYSDEIYQAAFNKMNRDKQKTEEIMQETFAIACMKVDQLYCSKSPFHWLLNVQRILIKREQFRLCMGKTKEGKYIFSKEISIDTLSKDQIPIEEVEFYEGSIFEELKKVLSEREIIFVEERYVKGKTYKEIADLLQFTESACTSFGNRIHQKIKKFFQERDKMSKNLDI